MGGSSRSPMFRYRSSSPVGLPIASAHSGRGHSCADTWGGVSPRLRVDLPQAIMLHAVGVPEFEVVSITTYRCRTCACPRLHRITPLASLHRRGADHGRCLPDIFDDWYNTKAGNYLDYLFFEFFALFVVKNRGLTAKITKSAEQRSPFHGQTSPDDCSNRYHASDDAARCRQHYSSFGSICRSAGGPSGRSSSISTQG
jgi:hypothetical protein